MPASSSVGFYQPRWAVDKISGKRKILLWQVGNFNKNEEKPLDVDFLIVDEYYEGIVRQLYKPTESCPVFSDMQSPIWALAKY